MKREKLLALRFPEKLWHLVNSQDPAYNFIKWDPSSSIAISVRGLSAHLKSKDSVFRVKTSAIFIQQLLIYGFKKLIKLKNSEYVEYSHHHFKRNNVDSLKKIKQNYSVTNELAKYAKLCMNKKNTKNFPINVYHERDPCFKKVTQPMGFKQLERTLVHLEIGFVKNYLESELHSKFDIENGEADQRSIDVNVPPKYTEPAIDFNKLPKITHVPGYYGDATLDKLRTCFGDYLPIQAQTVVNVCDFDLDIETVLMNGDPFFHMLP